jgi:predicted RNA-binding Zn-ribbon protein involved in translation (DUF1610 family)
MLACPECASLIPLKDIDFAVPFSCPQCGEDLAVSLTYSRVMGFIALGLAVGGAHSLGARDGVLLIVSVLAYFPTFWVVAVLTLAFCPPTVERNRTSILSRRR